MIGAFLAMHLLFLLLEGHAFLAHLCFPMIEFPLASIGFELLSLTLLVWKLQSGLHLGLIEAQLLSILYLLFAPILQEIKPKNYIS